jgi:hypothetical protein
MSHWDDLRCASCGSRRGNEEHWTEAECQAVWGSCILAHEEKHHAFVSCEPRITIVREMLQWWKLRNGCLRLGTEALHSGAMFTCEYWKREASSTQEALAALRRVWRAVRDA